MGTVITHNIDTNVNNKQTLQSWHFTSVQHSATWLCFLFDFLFNLLHNQCQPNRAFEGIFRNWKLDWTPDNGGRKVSISNMIQYQSDLGPQVAKKWQLDLKIGVLFSTHKINLPNIQFNLQNILKQSCQELWIKEYYLTSSGKVVKVAEV